MVLQIMTPLCLKIIPQVEQSDEPDPHFITFIATDIEIKANGIKGDYQNCSGD